MKVKIDRPYYSRLRNDEYTLVALHTIGICGKYDNKMLYLDKSYNELYTFYPVLESIKVHERKNMKIAQLNDLDMERDILITCTNNVVKGFRNVELPEITPHYDTLDKLLNVHQAKTIAGDNRLSETERLLKLEADIKDSEVAQIALQAFGLQPVITRLFASNKEYDVLFREYISEKSTKEHIDVLALRRSCTKALGQYFDAIQYCAFAHEDLDYTPLVNELNQLSAYINQQLKTRATRRKSGKNTGEEETPIELPGPGYNWN
jgi:hypothetical protein